MRIYTRTGDRGETSRLDGTRVPKSDARVDACGEVDELNAWLGVVRAAGTDPEMDETLDRLQRDLFALGAQVADSARRIGEGVEKATLGEKDIRRLEEWIDRFELELPALRRFILPGGSGAAAALHVARAVCRRAERRLVSLGPDALAPPCLAYVNRLSDLLFVLARLANRRSGSPDIEWS